MSLHDLTSPSTSTTNSNNSSFTEDIKWTPLIRSMSSPGQSQIHGQDVQDRSGVESGRSNNSLPRLRLSNTIKGFIRSYIGSQSLSSSGSGDPGTESWEDGLFHFVKLRDVRVEKEDIQRWIKGHSWILSEAYHPPRPTTNFNFPFPQNNPRNELEEQLYGVGGGSFFLNEQQHINNNTAPPVSTGTGNGTIGVGISPPTFEMLSLRKKLEQLQSVSTIVMTLNETLRAAGLEPLRAHVDCLNPLINTISRVTKNILKGSSRPEVLAQQLQLDLNGGSGSDFVIIRKQQTETVTEIRNDEGDQGEGDRESDGDDISVISPVVL